MKKEKVTLTLYSKSPHTSAIIAGCLMLEKKGRISLKIKSGISLRQLPHDHIVLMETRGKRIVFDEADGYICGNDMDLNDFIRSVDYYFKRSYSEEKNRELIDQELRERIYPLGFNYHVTYRNNPIDPDIGIKRRLRNYIAEWPTVHYYVPKVFEGKAEKRNRTLKIVFMTRLWNPTVETSFAQEELDYINGMRIRIIRELKQRYGNDFIGGIQKDKYSIERCPDIIIDDKYTNRKEYLKLMKKSDICIGTIGLHESIGWKTGEYVAAARAIVNEEFRYKVPGGFETGKNYLSFTSLEECLEKVDWLYSHKEEVFRMKRENERYYQKYLRPDRQIEYALSCVFGEKASE